jgi:hypothetical protein
MGWGCRCVTGGTECANAPESPSGWTLDGRSYTVQRATGKSLYAMGLGLGVSLAVATLGGLLQFAARRHARSAPGAEPRATAPDGIEPARTPALEGAAPNIVSG